MKITVNGVFDPNENEIISKLLKTKILSAHHSHPIDKIKIEIFTDKEKIMVELGRDSQNKTEYWVFYNDTSREIGRIETEYFDRY